MNKDTLRETLYLVARSWAIRLGACLWIVASLVLCALTPTGVPGFLHALGINLLVGTLGLWISLTIGQLARRIHEERGPLADALEAEWSPGQPSLARPFLASSLFLIALVVASFTIALANGLRVGLCEVWSTIPYYLVLPVASGILVSALGSVIAALTKRLLPGGLLAAGILLASGIVTAWPILTGPQAFAYNHLLGHVPGPIYDELFEIDGAVLGWRALSSSWAALLLGAGALLFDPRSNGLRPRPFVRRRWALALTLVSLVSIAGLQLKRSDIGFYQTHASIAAALGGEKRTERFIVYYPAERSDEWLDKVVRDHEYQYEVLADWLDLDDEDTEIVRSYVFRSIAEKGRLTGAARTSIAKPWLWAMYIHDRPYPHPILRHELAHVLAASFGSFPFQVSSHGPLSMNTGLIEGVAVAADWPADELSVHGWASAMRKIDVAPDIRGLFSAAGFFSQSSSTAYTLAGSFIRWLADERGVEAIKAAYAAGDLSVLGDPEDLFSAWEAFLDDWPVSEDALRLAEHRFRRPSIFRRPCAFDVSAATARARRALSSGRHEEAARWFERAADLEPQDPRHLKGLLDVHVAADDPRKAQEVANRALGHEGASARLRADVEMVLGDLAWREDDVESALEHYAKVASLTSSAALARLAAAKSLAAEDPALSTSLRPFLLGDLRRSLAPLHLRELMDDHPDHALLSYLLGRQVFNAGEPGWASRYLELAKEIGMPDAGGLRLECLHLLARALYEEGREPLRASMLWEGLAKDPEALEGRRIQAMDWARRAEFLADSTQSRQE